MSTTVPLIYLKEAMVTFGGHPVFQGLDIALSGQDRLCLVGRNGSGKSTLLQILSGHHELDAGERFVKPATHIGYLPQNPVFAANASVHSHIFTDLVQPEHIGLADKMCRELDLPLDSPMSVLSGGQQRRADIVRILCRTPEILLLDEPTNHLDLFAIEWLEGTIKRSKSAFVIISHDRAFVKSLCNGLLWLERGKLYRTDQKIDDFDAWAADILEHESTVLHKMERRIETETVWSREGISARRKRNQGRLRKLTEMRKNFNSHVHALGKVKLPPPTQRNNSVFVLEAVKISFAYPDKPALFNDFSLKIQRGERIGIIGANGLGKSTLIQILTHDLSPNTGWVKHGIGLQPLYFDQLRQNLQPEQTPWQLLCPGGGETLIVSNKTIHVTRYLKNFLFTDLQFRTPVGQLSGGEKNRLLLAKLFASEGNLLILDEPTNDLDLETMDILQDAIDDFPGTVILVSHDRDFLDRTVTSILAFEGNGEIQQYAGGYSDYLRQRKENSKTTKAETNSAPPPLNDSPKILRKLSYKDQRELDMLPELLDQLTKTIQKLEERLNDSGLFQKNPDEFHRLAEQLEAKRTELAHAEERWLELTMLQETMTG